MRNIKSHGLLAQHLGWLVGLFIWLFLDFVCVALVAGGLSIEVLEGGHSSHTADVEMEAQQNVDGNQQKAAQNNQSQSAPLAGSGLLIKLALIGENKDPNGLANRVE